jgi:AI-2 transport protein TqsA
VTQLSQTTGGRWGLNGLILLGLSLGLYFGRLIFIPAVIALLLACMLWPAVAWLNLTGVPFPGLGRGRWARVRPVVWRARVPWALACAAAVAILVVLVIGVTAAFALVIPQFVQALPNDPVKAQELYSRVRERAERISPAPLDPAYFPEKAEDSEIVKYVSNALNPNNPQFVFDTLLRLGAVGGNWLWQSILILFILLFMLLEGRMLTRRLVEVFTAPEAQARALVALGEIANAVRAFLVWRTIINFAMALILGLVYHLLELRLAWTWALLTGLLLYVPYLGPILAGIGPVLDALVTIDSPWAAVGLLAFYVAFVTLEGYFIVPVVMGRSMELNATTVMLSCLYWELVWGWAGLFLAMPLMAAAKSVCYHVPGWRPWANLMDTRAGPADEDAAPTQLLPADGVAVERTERIQEQRR